MGKWRKLALTPALSPRRGGASIARMAVKSRRVRYASDAAKALLLVKRRLRAPCPVTSGSKASFFLSLPVRNERGESRREGPSRRITPPLPDPLLPPASGREGEAVSPGGY